MPRSFWMWAEMKLTEPENMFPDTDAARIFRGNAERLFGNGRN